jgi:hypothetical protein
LVYLARPPRAEIPTVFYHVFFRKEDLLLEVTA